MDRNFFCRQTFIITVLHAIVCFRPNALCACSKSFFTNNTSNYCTASYHGSRHGKLRYNISQSAHRPGHVTTKTFIGRNFLRKKFAASISCRCCFCLFVAGKPNDGKRLIQQLFFLPSSTLRRKHEKFLTVRGYLPQNKNKEHNSVQ